MINHTPSTPQSKYCPKCKTTKPIDDFARDKYRKSGHCVHCKVCNKEYRQNNTEKLRQSQKNSVSKINGNPELLEKRREEDRRYFRKRLELFPEQEKIRRHKRRAEIFAGGGSYTSLEWLTLCDKYENRCLCCKEKKSLTVDHVKAISLGGSNSIENIQPLCKSCNSKKGKKEIDFRS